MTARRTLFLAVVAAHVVACSQVLGIEDRAPYDTDAGDEASVPSPADDGGSSGSSRDGQTSSFEAGTTSLGNDPPRAQLSGTTFDFGLVGCGAGAPPPRSITINNAGDSELDWSATLGPTSTFSIVGQSAGPIQGQQSTTLTVASVGFEPFATAGQTSDAYIDLAVSIPDAGVTTQRLTITQMAAGGTLVVNPGAVSFGQVPVGSSATPISVGIQNVGNLSISVMVGTPTDSQFSLASDAGVLVLNPSESLSGLTARFTPAANASATASTAIVVGGNPVCGAVPSGLQLSGQGTSGPVAIQPGSLDFGLVPCGATAAPKQVTVTATGASVSWMASLAKGASSPYALSAASGTASSASPSIVTVSPKLVPGTSPVTPDYYIDVLSIVAPDGTHTIPLHETAQGAILSQSQSSIAFGGVNVGTSATSRFSVVNDGNVSADVTYASTGAFTTTPQTQTVGGQGSSSLTTVTFAPTAATAYSGTATLSVSGATILCGPLPAAVSLSGTGTRTYVDVSASSLDFGLVKCGATGKAAAFAIANTAGGGGASFDWTATLGKGSASPYVLSVSSGTVKAGKSATLTVTPKAIPQVSSVATDLYADSLTITTNAANDSTPHVVSLHETAQGGIVTVSPTSLSFGSIADGSATSMPVQITNSGNLPVTVSLGLSGGASTYYGAPASSSVNGASAVSADVTFHPPKGSSGTKTATVTPTFPQTSCGTTPSPITLSGTGI